MNKTEQKFEAVFNLLINLKESYNTSTQYQKEFLSTIVGAAIYYLPTNKQTYIQRNDKRKGIGITQEQKSQRTRIPKKNRW